MNYKVSEVHPYEVGPSNHRVRVKMLSNHKELGSKPGEWLITGAVKFADYKRGIIVTRNSIYIWRV